MYHPLNALFDLQRALESRLDSDWLRGETAGTGAFPPINVFQQGDNLVAIAGEEFVYEMTLNALLLPNAGGVPTWQSNEIGEKQMIKLPEQFRGLLLGAKGPLSEEIGQELATWAAGTDPELDPEDFVIPAAYSKGHAGNPLRQYDMEKLEFFANHDKAPHALREAARRVIAARTAPEPGASDEPDDVPDYDPETGEVHDDAHDSEDDAPSDEATA